MCRNFLLEWFELFISQTLADVHAHSNLINAAFVRESLKRIDSERKRVRHELLRDIFWTASESEMAAMVQRYQFMLYYLLDELDACEQRFSNKLLDIIYIRLQACITDILELLENSFGRYFEQDRKVPESYLRSCREQLGRDIGNLEDKLFKLKQDARLVQIVVDHVRAFITSQQPHLSYRNYKYVIGAWQELMWSPLYSKSGRELPILVELLIRINYNSSAFTSYFINEYMVSLLNKAGSTDEKIRAVYHLRILIQQVSTSSKIPLLADLPDISDQIMNRLEEELTFLRASPFQPADSGTISGEFKIQTTLPVPVMAAAVRVFKEGGVILNTNVKKMLEFISQHYSSMKQEKISYTHLQSSYYDIDPRNKERLYDMLIMLANVCKKM
ncbi:hypothetical protein [Chitinophaga vietnamensis]|uniref:hypothetical protein n=1 Tax=Chitinophaga vietnamensis TaxID=2593957 RepID=UPI001178410F|nr:hypothetical protein [Chitinophaga vietnamensis]